MYRRQIISNLEGVIIISKYIDNVNTYLSTMKIKQTYVSLKSGIDVKKLSRLLTGVQEITISDMEGIARALGKNVEFFLAEEFARPAGVSSGDVDAVFYAGEPSAEQEEFARQLIDLVKNADEVLGARGRYLMAMGE